MIDLHSCAERLAANADVFRHLVTGLSDEKVRWKPAPDKWSILEVVNHLADEERDDFRRRLDLTLHHPGEAWPPIDPPRWAVERAYNSRELKDSLDDFLAERAQSVAWLRALPSANWEAAYDHPQAGRICAGDLMASWLAHDLFHFRQITRLRYAYLSEEVEPFSVAYAGAW